MNSDFHLNNSINNPSRKLPIRMNSESENVYFGIKSGIGIWKFRSLHESPNIGSTPDYSYPVGFSLGFYIEKKFSEHFSLVAELLYQRSNAKITIYTGYEGILDQEINSQYLSLPILIKYQTCLWGIYFFSGPSISYLIEANYNFYDQIYFDKGNVNITEHLPMISTAIEIGLGKEMKVSNSNLNLELRWQWGLSTFQYDGTTEYVGIGSWKGIGLLFLIGYRFN